MEGGWVVSSYPCTPTFLFNDVALLPKKYTLIDRWTFKEKLLT